jgi:quercetin dioxygenase-like cupin family protein
MTARKAAATKRPGGLKPLKAYRKVVNYRTARFKPYALQGEIQKDLTWCNVSYDAKTGQGIFLIKFAPGGTSIAHEHLDYEEFIVLEGDLTDSDGTTYRQGDVVSLKPGSRHFSVSHGGLTALTIVRGGFRTLRPKEKLSP